MEELRDFFRLSKSERKGAAVLLVLLVSAYFLNRWLTDRQDADQFASPADWKAFDQWLHSGQKEETVQLSFSFDPDTLDSATWVSLGLKPGVVKALLRYRHAIGGFREKKELASFRLFPEGFVEELDGRLVFQTTKVPEPHAEEGPAQTGEEKRFENSTFHQAHTKPISELDVNFADSAAWEALPGIGAGTAGRICKYRERLGGFHDLAQIAEVWGVKPENLEKALPYLRLKEESHRTFCLNDLKAEDMADHPYIGRRLARVISSYAAQHGPFREVVELKGCVLITDSVYVKLQPYLRICD